MTNVPLPPGIRLAMSRQVFIPNYAHDPAQGGRWFQIDLNPLLTPTEDSMEELLGVVPAWYATLRWYSFLSNVMASNVKRITMDRIARNSHENRTYIERYILPGDYDYVYWKQQAEWLAGAVATIKESLIPLLQTSNANRRVEAAAVYNPPTP